MKLLSNLPYNQGVSASRDGSGGRPGRVMIPAGGSLELADSVWANVSETKVVKNLIKSGLIKILVAPKQSDKQVAAGKAKALAAAKALIAEAEAEVVVEVVVEAKASAVKKSKATAKAEAK